MQPVLVVKDERFREHLKQIPHLESPRRVKAIHEILSDASLQGRLSELMGEGTVEIDKLYRTIHSAHDWEKVMSSRSQLVVPVQYLNRRLDEYSNKRLCKLNNRQPQS